MSSLTPNNIFVIFSPGSGGNHLANLISTDKNFIARFDIKNYTDDTKKAHYFDNKTLEKDKINLKEILKQQRVYSSHFFEFSGFGFAKLLKKQFVVLTMPNEDSKGHKRMSALYNAFNDSYFFYEMKKLYTGKTFKKLFDIQEDCLEINGQELFESKNFINDLFTKCKKIGINLDKDTCSKAHELWLSKIYSP